MSRARTIVLTLLAFVSACGMVFAAADRPGWDFNSRAAQAAGRKYEEAESNARQDYHRRLTAARDLTVKELGDAMRAATRAGDLDEANRIKAAVAQLNEQSPEPGGGQGPAGRWDVHYSNGVDREYEIRAGGTVAWRNLNRRGKGQGRLQRLEGAWLLPDDGEGNAERLAVAGDRLYFEHFHPASGYPDEVTRTLAVGTRSARKPK